MADAIEATFTALRGAIKDELAKTPTVETAKKMAALGLMGVTLLESLLTDVRRNADALERIAAAIERPQMGIDGWTLASNAPEVPST